MFEDTQTAFLGLHTPDFPPPPEVSFPPVLLYLTLTSSSLLPHLTASPHTPQCSRPPNSLPQLNLLLFLLLKEPEACSVALTSRPTPGPWPVP